MTANFQEIEDGEKLFDLIRTKQPDAPLMVMEFWTGWFDHWGEEHHKYSDTGKKCHICCLLLKYFRQ